MKSSDIDQDLFTDSYCKVCSAQLISESQRVAHYEVSVALLTQLVWLLGLEDTHFWGWGVFRTASRKPVSCEFTPRPWLLPTFYLILFINIVTCVSALRDSLGFLPLLILCEECTSNILVPLPPSAYDMKTGSKTLTSHTENMVSGSKRHILHGEPFLLVSALNGHQNVEVSCHYNEVLNGHQNVEVPCHRNKV